MFKFTDPIIALEHIKINKQAYVLIISDLRMPGLGGLELIKETKRLNHNIRTVLMTAFDIDDIMFKEYTKKNILNGFLQKPIKIREMYTEVDKQVHLHEVHA